jgi:hypothetical protein
VPNATSEQRLVQTKLIDIPQKMDTESAADEVKFNKIWYLNHLSRHEEKNRICNNLMQKTVTGHLIEMKQHSTDTIPTQSQTISESFFQFHDTEALSDSPPFSHVVHHQHFLMTHQVKY